MLRVTATLIVGLLAVNGKSDTARRLQVEEQLLRRRNVWDDIEDAFVEIGDWVVDDVWEPIEDWQGWDDFANAMIDIGDFVTDDMWDLETWEDIGEWTADEFVEGWDDMVSGLDDAWQWVKGAGELIGDIFVKLDCWWDQEVMGELCNQCVKDGCNSALDEETIKKIDQANSAALMDMDDEFEPMLATCASAMEFCPAVSDCQELYALPESTRAIESIAKTIATCNLCYQCLPYGSTNEGCQKALDDVYPNSCEGCTSTQEQKYKVFYSCSSVETIVVAIGKLGEEYSEGGDAYDALNQICQYCEHCSGYQTELQKTCTDWRNISQNWDKQAPVVPDVLCLNEEGCPAPEDDVEFEAPTSSTSTPEVIVTPSPTQSPTQSPTPSPTQSPIPTPTQQSGSNGRPSGGRYPRPTPQPTSSGRPGSNGRPSGGSTGGSPGRRPGRGGRRLRL